MIMKIWQQDWISKWTDTSPNKIAIKEHESGKELTYSQLNRLGNRLANYLTTEIKLVKGDRIVIVSDNRIEFFILFVAAQKTGIILVPLNHRLTASELKYLITTTNPKLLLFDVEHKNVVLESINDASKLMKFYSFTELQLLFDYNQESEFNGDFKITKVKPNDPIFILFTSGTTGYPKGVLYTHKMMFWNSVNTSMSLIINRETRTIVNLPLFHSGGWNVLATPVLHHGGYFVLTKSFNAQVILQSIEKEKLDIFMGVPTMLKMISDEEIFKTTNLSSLQYIIVGGEPMPIPLIEEFNKKGIAIRQGYGLTEVGPNLTSLHQGDAIRKKGSIGKPNFYVSIKIKKDNTNIDSQVKKGELLLKGPMVTPGYWQNKEATKQAIKKGWFHTGDIVTIDEEGYLYIVDRIKNMYISGGENVYPAEVERILLEHPAILEAIVVNVTDEKWGESGKAFIATKNSNSITELEIIEFCKTRLAKFKIPKYFEFLDELPRNDTGKLDRKLLKNL